MKPLIIANWKMNPCSKEEAASLAERIKPDIESETVLCPPLCFLSFINGGFKKGAQNVFWEEEGAFTGEVSSSMLKSLDVDYVIVGHSERREYFSETDEIVNKKALSVQKRGLTPIVCVGEKEEERGKAKEILEREIKEGLRNLGPEIVLAYEPIWAIGTGAACSKKDALEIRKVISDILKDNFGDKFSKIPILYGGSVKSHNAKSYVKEAGFNGLLVGGASLNPEEFNRIIREAV